VHLKLHLLVTEILI